jgi:peptide-methionine (S)-S-oxide reductase
MSRRFTALVNGLLAASVAMLLPLAVHAQQATPAAPPGLAKAVFAGGCFWCMEPPFDALEGVISTTSGYTGGKEANPTYDRVSSGRTTHTEAVEIVFDPRKVTFERLLEVFWRNVDPTDKGGQFCDRGPHYRPEIFVHDDTQRKAAEASKALVGKTKSFPQPIVVPITTASTFYAAEEYHQDFYKKNPVRYKFYRAGCGRDGRLRELWGEPKSAG